MKRREIMSTLINEVRLFDRWSFDPPPGMIPHSRIIHSMQKSDQNSTRFWDTPTNEERSNNLAEKMLSKETEPQEEIYESVRLLFEENVLGVQEEMAQPMITSVEGSFCPEETLS